MLCCIGLWGSTWIEPTDTDEPQLVGGWATPLKNIKVNWDDYSQYMGKQKMATKTPTSWKMIYKWRVNLPLDA